jgi:rsbT co-antagonist protein RsbR
MSEAMTAASNPLAALLVAQHDALVERLARQAIAPRPGAEPNWWASIPPERLREGIAASFAAIARDLEAGTWQHYARRMVAIAGPRVRAGITMVDIRSAMDDVSGVLRELARQLKEPAEQVAAFEQIGLIIESAWASAFANFGEAMRAAVEDAYRAVISALSVPIIPVHAGVLVLPLVGRIDHARGELLTATLLPAIAREQAYGVLLDVTGVPGLDAEVAGWLLGIARSARLLGAEVVLVGISPEIARTMVEAGLDVRGLVAFGTLQAGLEHVLARRGLVITRRASGTARA